MAPRVLFAASGKTDGSTDVMATAHILWSAQSFPVPLGSGGSAESIASSTGGQPLRGTPDLHSVFAKEIQLGLVPDKALLHLFAFTRYRLYVNGQYVCRGPNRYQNQRPEYDTRDILALLRPGRNTVVVLVHRDAPTGRIMRHDPGFVAAIELQQGAKRTLIPTDASWLSMPELSFGPRPEAWASIHEHLDARKTPDWTRPDLTSAVWQPSVLVPGGDQITLFPRSSPPQREAIRAWNSGAPNLPLDLTPGHDVTFGISEIAQAYSLLDFDADEGSKLELTYVLPENTGNGTCTYIARAGRQSWMSGDTFALTAIRVRLVSGRVRLLGASVTEVRYPFDRAASFTCSDPFLTQLWGICARSLEVLSEDSYVDCADRERVEWTDDSPPAFDCTRVMMRGPDENGQPRWADARLLRDLLRRIALTQQPDGQLKAHSCSERFDIHAIMEDRSCDWVVLLRDYYESTGDPELVRELWPTLNRLFDWSRQRMTPRGLVLAREWEVWDNPIRYQVCEGAGMNAMLYRVLVDAAALAQGVGFRPAAQSLTREATQLRDAFNLHLWNEKESAYDAGLFGPGSEIHIQLDRPFLGGIVDGRYRPTAQSNLFALYGGIVPAERMATVRQWVLDHEDQVIGGMSHLYYFRMLYGMDDEAAERRALDRMRIAWKLQVESPWQTTWEECVNGAGSKVHIYCMHPGYFLTAFVLGARRDAPAAQRMIVIEPHFTGLDWAKGVCVTEFGPVDISWKRSVEGSLELTCTVPTSVQATLRLRAPTATSALTIDGTVVTALREGGWLTASLAPGAHTIQLKP